MLMSFRLPLPSSPDVFPSRPVRHLGSFREFLRSHPPSGYTTVQTTCAGRAVPQFDFHVARLRRGGPSVAGVEAPPASALAAACAAAVRTLPALEEHCTREVVLVVILSSADPDGAQGGEWLHIHADWAADQGSLVPKPVEARGPPRPRAHLKDTAWVAARAYLERARGADAVETILLGTRDNKGQVLLEGLVSNLFVLMRDGTLHTADGGEILSGSVRDVVVRAAGRRGIKVVEEPPAVADCQHFDAAFLTNAITLVAPISEIRFPTVTDYPTVELPNSSRALGVLDSLRRDVIRDLEERSTRIAPS